MNILLLDDDYIINEQLKSLTYLENNWKIVKANEIDYDKVDLVIVDVFNEEYNQLLQNILKTNTKIRTISVSDKLSRKLDKGCEYCTSNYNRIRLIKPLKLKVLFDSIRNFDHIESCPLLDAFENLDDLIEIVIKQFKNLLYDKELNLITSTSDPESKEYTMQILALLTLLDKNEIQYTLLNDSSVKINI